MSNPNSKCRGGDEWAQKELLPTLSNTMIGVVALQGAFKEHCKMITSLGARAREVRGYVCACLFLVVRTPDGTDFRASD